MRPALRPFASRMSTRQQEKSLQISGRVRWMVQYPLLSSFFTLKNGQASGSRSKIPVSEYSAVLSLSIATSVTSPVYWFSSRNLPSPKSSFIRWTSPRWLQHSPHWAHSNGTGIHLFCYRTVAADKPLTYPEKDGYSSATSLSEIPLNFIGQQTGSFTFAPRPVSPFKCHIPTCAW